MVLERKDGNCLFTLHGSGSTPDEAGRDCWEALVGLVGAPDEDDLPESLKDDLVACRAMMQAAREWAKGEVPSDAIVRKVLDAFAVGGEDSDVLYAIQQAVRWNAQGEGDAER